MITTKNAKKKRSGNSNGNRKSILLEYCAPRDNVFPAPHYGSETWTITDISIIKAFKR